MERTIPKDPVMDAAKRRKVCWQRRKGSRIIIARMAIMMGVITERARRGRLIISEKTSVSKELAK